MTRGFTLLELIISLAIFAVMTALVVAKYGNFNQSTLLTDTAYDVAFVLREAQTYGVSVRNADAGYGNDFSGSYGVDFVPNGVSGNACGSSPTVITLFAGSCSGSTNISSYTLVRGATVASVCAANGGPSSCSGGGSGGGSGPSPSPVPVTGLEVIFHRPNPDAEICASDGDSWSCNYTFASITLVSSDGSDSRTVTVRQTGQISVLQ